MSWKPISLVLGAFLLASSVGALNLEKPAQVRIVHGVFLGDNGEHLKFTIAEGHPLKLTNRATNTSYQLFLGKLSEDRATLQIKDADSAQELERFDLGLNENSKRGLIVPFSLQLTRITVEKAPRQQSGIEAASAASTSTAGNAEQLGSCCVGCGDWTVCCEPSAGWCCGLQCVGGDSCSACSAQ